jgi:hypothetical protein
MPATIAGDQRVSGTTFSVFIVAWLCGPRSMACADESTIRTVAGTGQPENNGQAGAALQMNLGDPFGVEIGPDGALYATEVRNHRVWRIDGPRPQQGSSHRHQ